MIQIRFFHWISVVLLCALGPFFSPVFALEEQTSTAELVQSAPYVAHVRVETMRKVSGPFPINNYRVLLLENLKGKLPQSFEVRIVTTSRVVHPSARPVRPGTEWILILGRKNKEGIYPLRSLTWGKIDLIQHPRTGDFYLSRPVTGFSGRSAVRMTLQEFRARVQSLLGTKGN